MATRSFSEWTAGSSKLAAWLSFLTGLGVLAGWMLDVARLKSVFAGAPKMAPSTAFCFVVAGISLWSVKVRQSEAATIGIRRLMPAGAAFLALVGLFKLSEYVLGWDMGVDRLLFAEPPNTPNPARMAPATALDFVLLAGSFALSQTRRLLAFQSFAILGGCVAWLGLSRYVYGGEPLLPLAEMSIHTALLFLIVNAGVLSVRTDSGLMALLTSETTAGLTARRLVPAVLFLPLALGWLRLQGQRAGWYGTEAGTTLVALATVVVFGGLVWRAAMLLERSEGDRRVAEERTRASERFLASVVESSLDAIVVMNHEGRVIEFNPAAEQIFGYRRSEIVGRLLGETLVPEPMRRQHREGLARYLATGEARAVGRRLELTGLRSDGSEVPVELSICRMPGTSPPTFAGFLRDITEQRRTAEALRQSQEQYRVLAESLPHLVWTCLPEGPCDYLSRQWVEYTGRLASEQLGYGWADHLHPDDRPRVEAEWAKATKRGDRFDIEFRIRRADGVYRWFKTRALPLRDDSGKIVKWFGSNTDWDDQKHAEERLHTQLGRMHLLDHITRAIGQRQDLRSIFQVVIRNLEESLPVDFGCICLYEAEPEKLRVSCVGQRSAGLASDLGIADDVAIDVDPNGLSRCVRGTLVYERDTSSIAFPFPQRLTRAGLRALVAAPLLVESQVFGILLVARQAADSFSSGECEFLRQLSIHIALAAQQAELHSSLQRAYDDLRRTQQAVVQQERLQALGQMASGIAHDINNALSPVTLYMETLLESESNLSARGRSHLEIMQRAIDDVAQTVARMGEFYRQHESRQMAPVALNQLVQQVVALTRARWSDMAQRQGRVIELRTELAENLPAIAGIEGEIREALTNLIFNAVDAMPEGGTLTLRTSVSNAASAAEECRVNVDVVDTGIGMDESTRSRCLEPFFTTKGERGTGLGLAMVYGVVQRHNGEVEIESAVGEGTAMRLRFASISGDAIQPAVFDLRVPSPLRILVVDDSPLLVDLLRETLEADGHIVTTANGGQEGIDIFRDSANESRFEVVITDLGMPHVDGRVVAKEVKKTSPLTPVILLTGWGQGLAADQDISPYVDRVLGKPPKLRELREALAQSCSRESSG